MTGWVNWVHYMPRYEKIKAVYKSDIEKDNKRRHECDIEKDNVEETWQCFDHNTGSYVIVKWKPYCAVAENITMTEVYVLKELDHDKILRISAVKKIKEGIYLVCDHLDFVFAFDYFYENQDGIKKILFQILQVLCYCHSKKFIYRNLAEKNILFDSQTYGVKLTGFHYAKKAEAPLSDYPYPITDTYFHYRAPELLLHMPYTSAVDVWSVGCLFAKLLTELHLFCGCTAAGVLSNIIRALGIPNETPGITSACLKVLSNEELSSIQVVGLEEAILGLVEDPGPHVFKPDVFDLLSKMLCMDPSKRITCEDALKHPYFKNKNRITCEDAVKHPYLKE